MKKEMSIKKIAELSGVSVATVSRVINNNGRFSEETRKKIMKVIEETNYKTNAIAKSLRMNKSYTIGILVPDIANHFFAQVVQAIERIMFDQGYATIICNTARSQEKEKSYIKMLTSKMVDGLVVISGFDTFDVSNLGLDLPVICIDRKPINQKNVLTITSDHVQGGYLAAMELLEKGAKLPVIVLQRNALSSTKERLAGFKRAMNEAGIHMTDQHMINGDDKANNSEMIKKKVVEHLKKFPKVDGFFAINDRLAMSVIDAVHDCGLNIPDDIKVVGFDDDPIARYSTPKLTTIQHDVDQLAERICQSLQDLFAAKPSIDHHQQVAVTLINRETT